MCKYCTASPGCEVFLCFNSLIPTPWCNSTLINFFSGWKFLLPGLGRRVEMKFSLSLPLSPAKSLVKGAALLQCSESARMLIILKGLQFTVSSHGDGPLTKEVFYEQCEGRGQLSLTHFGVILGHFPVSCLLWDYMGPVVRFCFSSYTYSEIMNSLN